MALLHYSLLRRCCEPTCRLTRFTGALFSHVCRGIARPTARYPDFNYDQHPPFSAYKNFFWWGRRISPNLLRGNVTCNSTSLVVIPDFSIILFTSSILPNLEKKAVILSSLMSTGTKSLLYGCPSTRFL